MQRGLRFVLIAAILLSGLLLISGATLQSFGAVRLRVLLSLVDLGVGAFVALMQLGALETYRRWVLGGIVVLAISQVCFHLLVWSLWTTENDLVASGVGVLRRRSRVGPGPDAQRRGFGPT